MSNNIVVLKALIRNDEGKYLLLQRSETDTRRPLQWDLVGGQQDEGESFEEGLRREIREETGIEIEKATLGFTKCHTFKKEGKLYNYILLIFIATTSQENVTLSFEHSDHVWVDRDEVCRSYIVYENHRQAIEYIFDNNLDKLLA